MFDKVLSPTGERLHCASSARARSSASPPSRSDGRHRDRRAHRPRQDHAAPGADRASMPTGLPEERRRGMTIDVGYAHLDLPDGTSLDFVDVPGHDRLVGNMLVGAGEIDAALLVVAADDGPRAQTLRAPRAARRAGDPARARRRHEGRRRQPASAWKPVSPEVRDAARAHVARRSAGARGVGRRPAPGSMTLRDALLALAAIVSRQSVGSRGRGARDRPGVRGEGPRDRGHGHAARVTVAPGAELRAAPGRLTPSASARSRSMGRPSIAPPAAGPRCCSAAWRAPSSIAARCSRTTADRSRVLAHPRHASAGIRSRPRRGRSRHRTTVSRLRLHLRTEQVGALVVRSPRETVDLPDGAAIAILRLERPVAVAERDRFALRDPTGAGPAHGGVVLDPAPPRGVSRRRATPDRLARPASMRRQRSGDRRRRRLALHGLVDGVLAPDVADAVRPSAIDAVRRHHAEDPASAGATAIRDPCRRSARSLRRLVTRRRRDRARRPSPASTRRRARPRRAARPRRRSPSRPGAARRPRRPTSARRWIGSRRRLSTPSPPPLAEAARAAGCPPDGVRALEAERRIVRLEDDLAWSATTYRELARPRVDDGGGGSAHPGGVPRRDGRLAAVRAGDPRGPRPSRPPPPHGCGPRPRAGAVAGARRARREPTRAVMLARPAGRHRDRPGRRSVQPVRARQARRTGRGVPLLEHALDAVARVATEIVVAGGERRPAPAIGDPDPGRPRSRSRTAGRWSACSPAWRPPASRPP